MYAIIRAKPLHKNRAQTKDHRRKFVRENTMLCRKQISANRKFAIVAMNYCAHAAAVATAAAAASTLDTAYWLSLLYIVPN